MKNSINVFYFKWYAHINRIHMLIAILKTKFWYSLFFKSIGSGTIIFKPIFISNPEYITIGSNVIIRTGLRIETVLDGVNTPNLTIGNNVNIEQNVHIICHDNISIGDNVSITANCAIVDTSHPYAEVIENDKIGARLDTSKSPVKIGDNSFLGIGSIILPNVELGRNVIVGANTIVTKSVPSYSIVTGIPGRVIKTYCFVDKNWK